MAGLNIEDTISKAVDPIDKALETVRTHLGMEVAYLSEFVGEKSVFRAVSAPGLEALIKPGDTQNLEDIYCQHILDGRLPEVIPDTAEFALAQGLPITSQVPIGSHVSVPIHRADGSVYGMFCCLSPTPNPTLNERDLKVMRTFADMSAEHLHTVVADRIQIEKLSVAIETALAPGGYNVVYQPLFRLGSDLPIGFEALCRFTTDPYIPPDKMFGDAALIGRQAELEIAVADAALMALDSLPEDIYVSVNLSPETIVSAELTPRMQAAPAERIVLEITEHVAVSDYAKLMRRLDGLRALGMRLAIDDAGAGYSGLKHIVQLAPDIIKLDMALTSGIDTDMSLRSLSSALTHFSTETGATILAEGIETKGELDTLKSLGVQMGQGYFLGRPAPLDAALAWFDNDRPASGPTA